jgi:D-alanyl-D-alanine carboxypeptidase/D-alanyl-D-alanine-endopeptidase (penicillin-binding protein 4)
VRGSFGLNRWIWGLSWSCLGLGVGWSCAVPIAAAKDRPPAVVRKAAPAPTLSPDGLPEELHAVLKKHGIPAQALALTVAAADAPSPAYIRWNDQQPVNPASVMKLVTTYAALDLLGPQFTWRNQFWVDGSMQAGLLRGNLYIRGSGDPKFVMERIDAAFAAVRDAGITVVHGDIVLDDTAFAAQTTDPNSFDGERLRPYNVTPDGLLVNFKSIILKFTPDEASGIARVNAEPPLANLSISPSVPLSKAGCGDWRTGLRAQLDDPNAIRFSGNYPSRCGEKTWPVAYADPASYGPRAIEGMWRAGGGLLTGSVRRGSTPSHAQLLLETPSLPLSEIVTDINKFSNNVMAQQVFLTLGRLPSDALDHPSLGGANAINGPTATFERSRLLLTQWWQRRFGSQPLAPVLDNGSGLSRQERITAQGLLTLLRANLRHPNGTVLLDSLPIAGVDGTASRMADRGILKLALGNARIKTGSLRDVAAIAGYVQSRNNQALAIVAIINHPNAPQARPVLDAILEWAASRLNATHQP